MLARFVEDTGCKKIRSETDGEFKKLFKKWKFANITIILSLF